MFYNEHMFSFLKNNHKEEQTRLLLMVTSYSVTAAVVRTYHREGAVVQPVVLFSCERKIPQYHKFDQESLEQSIARESEYALEACRKVHGNYDALVCSMGEPWLLTKTRQCHLEKTKPFVVTQKIIDETIARDARLFEQEALRDYAYDQEWWMLAENKNHIDMNGYRVVQPLGKSAKEITIHVTYSLVPVRCIEIMNQVYARVFHREDVVYVGMNQLLDYWVDHDVKNETIIMLGGVSSDILVVRQGVLGVSQKINQGLVHFEKNMMDLFGVQSMQITSVMNLINDHRFLDHEKDIYHQRIIRAYQDLGKELVRVLHEIKKHQGVLGAIRIVNSPEWVAHFALLLELEIGQSVQVLSGDEYSRAFITTHGAQVTTGLLYTALQNLLEHKK